MRHYMAIPIAIAGMLVGFWLTFAWWLWFKGMLKSATGLDLYELFPGFVGGLVATIAVSLATRKPLEAQNFVDELKRPWHEAEHADQTAI